MIQTNQFQSTVTCASTNVDKMKVQIKWTLSQKLCFPEQSSLEDDVSIALLCAFRSSQSPFPDSCFITGGKYHTKSIQPIEPSFLWTRESFVQQRQPHYSASVCRLRQERCSCSRGAYCQFSFSRRCKGDSCCSCSCFGSAYQRWDAADSATGCWRLGKEGESRSGKFKNSRGTAGKMKRIIGVPNFIVKDNRKNITQSWIVCYLLLFIDTVWQQHVSQFTKFISIMISNSLKMLQM